MQERHRAEEYRHKRVQWVVLVSRVHAPSASTGLPPVKQAHHGQRRRHARPYLVLP